MSKLYPPYIEGTIPAFYIKYDPTGSVVRGAVLTVPFSMNPSVTEASVAGFALRIKTVLTGAYVFSPCITTDFSFINSNVTFNLTATLANLLNEGQYYKIQMAYCGSTYTNSTGTLASDDIGYYSTVGVIKCTSKPTISISGLTDDSVNLFSNEYTGIYDATDCNDLTERVYSYNFKIFDENNDLYWETGELLHSSANDTNYGFSSDKVYVSEFTTLGETYSILYNVTTLNGLELSTPKYKLTNDSFVTPSKTIDIIINSDEENLDNYDNGYIKINFKGELDVSRNKEAVYYGEYLLTRACEDDDYSTWIEISRFRLDDEEPSSVEIKDYTIELGKKYQYGLLQYNLWGLYSEKIKTDPIEGGFEDAFLFDGEKYLKIKYNPKISSFKTDILDTKQDTIGGKFPFIIRNGETNYKEFPIGGLIAAETDEQEFFVNRGYKALYRKSSFYSSTVSSKSVYVPDAPEIPAAFYIDEDSRTEAEQLTVDTYLAMKLAYDAIYGEYIAYNASISNANLIEDLLKAERDAEDEPYIRDYHDLTDDNIALERKFKLAVLDWLNDGKPKLFKSPTEGNYIVRLMNVSLTPEETLGRALHNFSCTAYEIADLTYENLLKYGFLKVEEPSDYVGLWRSYDLEHDYDAGEDIVINFESNLVSFVAQDFFPGDIIQIKYYDEGDYQSIQIGTTGSYYFDALGRTVTGLKISREDGNKLFGTIHCYYKGTRITEFDGVTNVMLKTIPSMLFIGVNPYLLYAKDTKWYVPTTRLKESVYPDIYKALSKTAFRDTLNNHTLKSGGIYTIDLEFVDAMENFEPGDILLNINSTIYTHIDEESGEKEYKEKVSLLNVELLKFRIRPLIPVYLVDYNSATNWESYTEPDYLWVKYKFVGEVSLTPFGKPYPIEELAEAEMLDPFCIFKVFGYMGNDVWLPISEDGSSYTKYGSYYDVHYKAWLSEYLPYYYINDKYFYNDLLYTNDNTGTIYSRDGLYYFYNGEKEIKFSTILEKETGATNYDESNILYIKQDDEYLPLCVYGLDSSNNYSWFLNPEVEITHANLYVPNAGMKYYLRQDNQIDLSIIQEKYYKNLGTIDKIVIGNGVMAEITFLLKVIDYYTESTNADVKAAKDKYIADAEFLLNLSASYEILDEANSYRNLYRAYIEAYDLLINGNKDTDLSDDSKQVLTASFLNPNTKYDMMLVGVYRTYFINDSLDSVSRALVDEQFEEKEVDEALSYLKECNIYSYQDDPLYTASTVLRTNDEYEEEKVAGNSSKYKLVNTDYSIIVENIEVLNDVLLTEYNDDSDFIKAELANDILYDDSGKKIEESELLILLNNSLSSPDTFKELPGVLNKELALDGTGGVIDLLKEKITEYEEKESEVKEDFDEKLLELRNKITNYNAIINPRLAWIELKRLLSYPQGIKSIEGFYSDTQDSIGEELIEVEERINNSITLYVLTYNTYYNTIISLLDSVKTYTKIKSDKTGDDELDDYLDDFIVSAKGAIFFDYYILIQLKNKIEELDSTLTLSSLNDLGINILDYSNSGRDVYYGKYSDLSSKVSKITLKELNSSTVDFADKKEVILGYDDLLIDKAALDYYNITYSLSLSSLKTAVDSYISELTIDQIKEINNEKNILAEKIPLTDSSTTTLDQLQLTYTSDSIPFDANAYYKFIFNPISSTVKDTEYITDDSIDSNLSYYNSLSSDEERKEILDNADDLIDNLLKNIAIINALISAGNASVMQDGEVSNTKICAYIDEKYLNAGYSVDEISENYITPLNTAISNFNGLIVDYLYELLDIQNRCIVAEDYINNITYYYYNGIYYSLCGSDFTIDETSFELGPKKFISSITDNKYYAKLLLYIIAKYNKDYDYNCDTSLTATYLLPLQSTTILEKYELDEDIINLSGDNSDNTGFLNWYITYVIENGMDELLVLLEQAELLAGIYKDLYDNYNEKYSDTYLSKYNEYTTIYNGYYGTDELAFYEGTNTMTVADYRELVRLDWIDFINILDIEYTKEAERGMYL